MKNLKVGHVILVIVLGWLIVIAPYLIPALNVSTRIIGIPLTVWLAIIAFAMCLFVNVIAVRYTWVTFDDSEDEDSKEVR